ncbi:MAG TPA: DUF1573 domain-containing protein, partial [Bacteroidetes bacterium]|nr:DUF1573 domain-containing protein [Bacteroidota bacterium]
YLGLEMIWPHAVACEYQGTQYVHAISNEHTANVTDEMDICYSRHEYDPVTGSLVVGEQTLVTGHGMNISADIGATEDGSRVAIAATVSRDWLYHADSLAAGTYNMDIWLWISEDGGQTWNWDDPIDLTSFTGPVGGPWPGERDTLRAYTDCNVYFDHDNVLHVAFTVHPFHFDPNPVVGKISIIYHWDEVNDVFTRVADGMFWNGAEPGAWQRIAQRPSMYQDPDTGILWLVYQQYGVPEDFNDMSDDGYANGEIFVTASPPGYYNGLLWTEGINITNTRYDQGGGAPAGECRNEREPSVALDNDGDYLYISYVLDLDAGFVVQGEGEYTENPVVVHRVMKQELIEEMESNGVWLPNVPMHWNGNQSWEDPLEWDWAAHGASFFPDPPPLPELHLLTELLDFGEVLVGGSDTLYVVMENTGDWELVISEVIPGLETFAVENVQNMTIAPAERDSFAVVFEPTEPGEYADTIFIVSDDPDSPETPVSLFGIGSPIPAPFNLTADLDILSGEVALAWDFNEAGLDAFLEFRLYRNGGLLWNGTDQSFT